MTLDEAIAHAREQGEKANCKKCKLEHLQLAGWLEDYKRLKYEKFTPSESFVYIAALRYSFGRLTGCIREIAKEIISHAQRFETWQLEQMIEELEDAERMYNVSQHFSRWAPENERCISNFKEMIGKELERRKHD